MHLYNSLQVQLQCKRKDRQKETCKNPRCSAAFHKLEASHCSRHIGLFVWTLPICPLVSGPNLAAGALRKIHC